MSLWQITRRRFPYVLQWGRVVEHVSHRRTYARGGVYRTISGAITRSLNAEKIAETLSQ